MNFVSVFGNFTYQYLSTKSTALCTILTNIGTYYVHSSDGKDYHLGLILLYFIAAAMFMMFYVLYKIMQPINKQPCQHGIYSNMYILQLNNKINLETFFDGVNADVDTIVKHIKYHQRTTSSFLRMMIKENESKFELKIFSCGKIQIISNLDYEQISVVAHTIVIELIKKYDVTILPNTDLEIDILERSIAYYMTSYPVDKFRFIYQQLSYKRYGIKVCEYKIHQYYHELKCSHQTTNNLIIKFYLTGKITVSARISNPKNSDNIIAKINKFIESLID